MSKILQIKIPVDIKRKIRLTKLSDEVFSGNHPNNINPGFVKEGFADNELKIGDSLWMDNLSWATSTIKEIIDDNTFRTLNSTYKIEYLS